MASRFTNCHGYGCLSHSHLSLYHAGPLMLRPFTRAQLYSVTTAEYLAMSPADRSAFDAALLALWTQTTADELSRDLAPLDSRQRFEHGE